MGAYGIDFGTTNSVVGRERGGAVSLLAIAQNLGEWELPNFRHLSPSVFGTLADGEAVVGWDAKLRSPHRIEAVKRMLRGDAALELAGREWSIEQVCAALFRGLRETAAALGQDLDDAVITVPANALGRARLRTRAAAGAAGIRALALINEPTAAAMGFVHRTGRQGPMLVYDFGGGTLDVTVLHAEGGRFFERASKGVALLGGLDLDQQLRRLVIENAAAESVPEDWQFSLEIERAKIKLSTDDAVTVALPDFSGIATVTRAEFEQRIEPLVEQSLAPVRRCLDELSLRGTDFEAVLLVGGTSLVPLVRERVSELLGVEPVSVSECEPLTAVGRGAAVAAGILNGQEGSLHLVAEHALGVDSKQGGSFDRKFSAIITRGSRLPRRDARTYRFDSHSPTRLRLNIYEGDETLPLDDPEQVKLGTYSVAFDADIMAGDPMFRVEFDYDISGILSVAAYAQASGRELLSGRCDFLDDEHAAERRAQEFVEVENFIERSLPVLPDAAVNAEDNSEPITSGDADLTLVVDGSNLAWIGQRGRKAKPSHAQLQSALEALSEQFPGVQLVTFVDATYRHLVDESERPAVEAAFDEGTLVQPPAGTKGRVDTLVCSYAERLQGKIVSNDSFKELHETHPWLLDAELLGASLVKGEWIFAPRSVVPERPKLVGRLLRRSVPTPAIMEQQKLPLDDPAASDEPSAAAAGEQAAEAAEAGAVPAQRKPDVDESLARHAEPRRLYAWQQEALDAWEQAGRCGVVEAVTGTGKTRVGVQAAEEALAQGERVLVLTPTVALARQWAAELGSELTVPVGLRAAGSTHTLRTHRVLAATVSSLAVARKLPLGEKGLLIADECHRYGAKTWSRALDLGFDARLGLTATYERDDSGIDDYLDPYFGEIVTSVDYERARRDDIIAPFSIAMVGVHLLPSEQEEYEAADGQAKSVANTLMTEFGLPERPFGEFMRIVQELAKSSMTRAERLARAYLSAFGRRRDILANSTAKLDAVAQLVPALESSNASLFFTQTKESARQCVDVCRSRGVEANALFSGQEEEEQLLVMREFREQSIKMLASPRMLDEGIDVPEADLGVIVSASHTKRQSIQRLGRILRKKADGRPARLVVVYAVGTTEDPKSNREPNAFLAFAGPAAEEIRTFDASQDAAELVEFLSVSAATRNCSETAM